MDAGPRSGERLWLDEPDRFVERLRSVEDAELRAAAHAFRDDGYLHLRNVVAGHLIDDAISAYEDWCATADPEKLAARGDLRRPRIVNLHSARDEIKRLFTQSEKVLAVADFLFGYRTSVYTSLTFQYGTEQPLHRDTPVFRTEPEEFYFGIWFALEDATEQNGALCALRGGHRGGRVDPFEFAREKLPSGEPVEPGGSPLWSPYQNAVTNASRTEGRGLVLLPAKRGDVIIWHPQLPHGGSPIADPSKTRMSVVFHVVPEGVPVYQADVFFDPKREAPRLSTFSYADFEGRQFVARSTVVGSN